VADWLAVAGWLAGYGWLAGWPGWLALVGWLNSIQAVHSGIPVPAYRSATCLADNL